MFIFPILINVRVYSLKYCKKCDNLILNLNKIGRKQIFRGKKKKSFNEKKGNNYFLIADYARQKIMQIFLGVREGQNWRTPYYDDPSMIWLSMRKKKKSFFTLWKGKFASCWCSDLNRQRISASVLKRVFNGVRMWRKSII